VNTAEISFFRLAALLDMYFNGHKLAFDGKFASQLSDTYVNPNMYLTDNFTVHRLGLDSGFRVSMQLTPSVLAQYPRMPDV